MARFFFCIALFFLGIDSFAQNDRYAQIEERIWSNYEKTNFDSVVILSKICYDLANIALNIDNQSIALQYMIEGLIKTNRWNDAQQGLKRLEYLAFEPNAEPSLELPGGINYKRIFAFYYYKADILYSGNLIDSALIAIKESIDFVNAHPEHYRNFAVVGDLNSIFEVKYNRLSQAHLILGDIYSNLKDNENASNAYAKAYQYGKLADSISIHAFHENLGRRISALEAYINFASTTNQQKLKEQLLNLEPESNTSTFYKLHKNTQNLTLINSMDRLSEKAVNIIKSFKESDLTKNNPNILLAIIKFYLRCGRYDLVQNDLNRYSQKIKPENETIWNKINFYTAKTRLSLHSRNMNLVEKYMTDLMKIIDSDINASSMSNTGELKLDVYKDLVSIYSTAYLASGNITFLKKIDHAAIELLPLLSSLRYSTEQGEDHSLLMIEFDNFINQVLAAEYKLQLNGEKINKDLIFQYMELNKSFNLQNEILLKNGMLDQGRRDRFNAIQIKIKEISSKIKASGQTDESLLLHWSELKSQKRQLIDSIRMPSIQLIKVADIQSHLSDGDSFIEFKFGSDFLYTLQLDKNEFHFFRAELNASRENISLLNSLVDYEHLMKDFTNRNPVERDSSWCSLSYRIYLSTLNPLSIHKFSRLIIIPDAYLNLISFGSLLTTPTNNAKYKTWPFLMKSHQLSIQHSANLWFEYNFDSVSGKQSRLALFSPQMADLKFHKEECKSLNDAYQNTQTLYDSKSFALSLLSRNSNILHIATHAQSDPIFEEKTFIRTATDTLYANEIAYDDFHQDLIFLSACETGTGEVIKEEGVFSLARCFFKAGARSVISTLWNINDQISKEQVLAIYDNLSRGMPKDEAIRQMQLSFIDNPDVSGKYAMPYFWASYQCQGDLRPLTGLVKARFVQKNLSDMLIGFVIVATGLLLYFRKRIGFVK